jgi:hypothetical protein
MNFTTLITPSISYPKNNMADLSAKEYLDKVRTNNIVMFVKK